MITCFDTFKECAIINLNSIYKIQFHSIATTNKAKELIAQFAKVKPSLQHGLKGRTSEGWVMVGVFSLPKAISESNLSNTMIMYLSKWMNLNEIEVDGLFM